MSDSLLCFIDYRSFPYALGDTFTLLMNMEIQRRLKGKDDIRQLVLADPHTPNSKYQPFVKEANFRNFLIELFPAYLFSPSTSKLGFTENRYYFYHQLVKNTLKREAVWPGLYSQARGVVDFYSHRMINRFFRDYGYVPRLEAPAALRDRAQRKMAKLFPGKLVVTVNLRNSKSGYFFSALHREAILPEWEKFFLQASRTHPHVIFLIVGSFGEWSRSFLNLPNVAISRRLGLGLADELSILLHSRLFMGSSSGFSALATFSSVPYVIANFEPSAASHVGLTIGEGRYPFAEKDQIILWEGETNAVLYENFSEVLSNDSLPTASINSTAGNMEAVRTSES